MKKSLLALLALLALASPLRAEDAPRPDDRVMFDLSAEQWVTTKTARVTVGVETSVNGANAGNARAEMMRGVNDLAKAEWRITSFNRSQDASGLDHWSALFEARLPESSLNGLADAAKKISKPGLQFSLAGIDFSPTLAEMEAARNDLRTQIYKSANEQLAALNTALPGRAYRIAMIDFGDRNGAPIAPQMMMKAMAMDGMARAPDVSAIDHAEKITLAAHVVFAATPDIKAAK